MKRIYQTPGPGTMPVYADTAMSQQIGRLFAGSSCTCIGEADGLAIVLYRIRTAPDSFKVGFADPAGISES